jgi:hypothetical protein
LSTSATSNHGQSWVDGQPDELLEGNAAKPAREQLTLIQIFEDLRGCGYDGGYDALLRYAKRWAKQHGKATAGTTVSGSDASSCRKNW